MSSSPGLCTPASSHLYTTPEESISSKKFFPAAPCRSKVKILKRDIISSNETSSIKVRSPHKKQRSKQLHDLLANAPLLVDQFSPAGGSSSTGRPTAAILPLFSPRWGKLGNAEERQLKHHPNKENDPHALSGRLPTFISWNDPPPARQQQQEQHVDCLRSGGSHARSTCSSEQTRIFDCLKLPLLDESLQQAAQQQAARLLPVRRGRNPFVQS